MMPPVRNTRTPSSEAEAGGAAGTAAFRGLGIGRTCRGAARGSVSRSPVQTVRADFPHTAYRWSSHAGMRTGGPVASTVHPGRYSRGGSPLSKSKPSILGTAPSRWLAAWRALTVGLLGLATMPSHLPSAHRDQSRVPSLQPTFVALPRYYEPLGLPPGSPAPSPSAYRRRVFARRRPPGRVSPVPHLSVARALLLTPEASCTLSGLTGAVCCLRRDMSGSASSPFGSYLTGLQRFASLGPPTCSPPTNLTAL